MEIADRIRSRCAVSGVLAPSRLTPGTEAEPDGSCCRFRAGEACGCRPDDDMHVPISDDALVRRLATLDVMTNLLTVLESIAGTEYADASKVSTVHETPAARGEMATFETMVGDDRHRIVETLVADYESIRAGGPAQLVVLEGGSGVGKTTLVRELYRRVAEQQPDPPYWPADILEGTRPLLEDPAGVIGARKMIYPDPAAKRDEDATPEYMWWGILCSEDGARRRTSTIGTEDQQLIHHVGDLVERRQGNKEFRGAAAAALAEVASVVVPGLGLILDVAGYSTSGRTVIEAAKKLLDRRRDAAPDATSMVAASIDTQAAAVAELVETLSARELPFIIVVDDAHFADPMLATALARIVAGSSRALILASAWPGFEDDSDADSGTLATVVVKAQELGRARVIEVAPLDDGDMAALFRAQVPGTDAALVDALVQRASGYPLAAMGALRVCVERRDIVSVDNAPRLEMKLEDVGGLPMTWPEILRVLWDRLPVDIRQLLAVATLQGPEFEKELALIGVRENGGDADDEDVMRTEDPLRLIRPKASRDVFEFAERIMFDVAKERRGGLISEDAVEKIRRRWLDEAVELLDQPAGESSELPAVLEMRLKAGFETAADPNFRPRDLPRGKVLKQIRDRLIAAAIRDQRLADVLRAHELWVAVVSRGRSTRFEDYVKAKREYAAACRDVGYYERAGEILEELIDELETEDAAHRLLGGVLVDMSTVCCDLSDWEAAEAHGVRASELLREGTPSSRLIAEVNLEVYRRCLGRYDLATSNREAQAAVAALDTPDAQFAEFGQGEDRRERPEQLVARRREWRQLENELTDAEAAHSPTSSEAAFATAKLADSLYDGNSYAPAVYHLDRLVRGIVDATPSQRGRAAGQLAVIRGEQGEGGAARRLLEELRESGTEVLEAAMLVPELPTLIEREGIEDLLESPATSPDPP